MAPFTNTRYKVSLLIFADVTLVAFDAVPVKAPTNDVAVTTPVTFNPPAVILTSSLNVEIPATFIPRNAPSGP